MSDPYGKECFPMTAKPSMKDIADRAGVSVMTVSYALRNHRSVSEDTIHNIQKLAREMGYTPNPMVASLIQNIRLKKENRHSPVIGYITSHPERDTWWGNYSVLRAYYEGAKHQCEKLGFQFEHFSLPDYNMSGKQLTKVLRYRNVCGILCAPVPDPAMDLGIDWQYFPCVAFGYSMPSPKIHRVTVNHFQAMLLALETLSQKGYQRIAVIASTKSSSRINNLFLAATDLFHRNVPKTHKIPIKIQAPSQNTQKKLEQWLRKHEADILVDTCHGICARILENGSTEFLRSFPYITSSWHESLPQRAGINQNSFQSGTLAVNVLTQLIYSNTPGIPELQSFTMVNGTWRDGASCPDRRAMAADRKFTPG